LSQPPADLGLKPHQWDGPWSNAAFPGSFFHISLPSNIYSLANGNTPALPPDAGRGCRDAPQNACKSPTTSVICNPAREPKAVMDFQIILQEE